MDKSNPQTAPMASISGRTNVRFVVDLTKRKRRMRLIIDVDKQYKKLFLEAAKAARARVQVDEQYLTEAEEEKALVKLVEEGHKQGRMNKEEQEDFDQWIKNR